jgi:hypothetical protein
LIRIRHSPCFPTNTTFLVCLLSSASCVLARFLLPLLALLAVASFALSAIFNSNLSVTVFFFFFFFAHPGFFPAQLWRLGEFHLPLGTRLWGWHENCRVQV